MQRHDKKQYEQRMFQGAWMVHTILLVNLGLHMTNILNVIISIQIIYIYTILFFQKQKKRQQYTKMQKIMLLFKIVTKRLHRNLIVFGNSRKHRMLHRSHRTVSMLCEQRKVSAKERASAIAVNLLQENGLIFHLKKNAIRKRRICKYFLKLNILSLKY